MRLSSLSTVLFLCVVLMRSAAAQPATAFQREYLEDFANTSKQLVQLAEAMPADKYGWRPGAGVRSVSEVYVHIASANFLLLEITGIQPPVAYYTAVNASEKNPLMALYQQNLRMEKSITAKDQVVKMLQESLNAVRDQFSKLSAADLDKPANFFGEQTTVRRVYLRIFAHANEHMGQAIAYARINGIVPPWSRPENAGK
ncbi:MAG: DinB family protein [Bryobacteraceae bacterium]|jgi:uncharacterized damage-inducible protein DinB